MPNDLPLAAVVVAIVATYLLHSTIFLVGVWLLLAVSRIQSAAFQERIWKVAAIAPLLTAPLQLAGAERFNATAVWTLPAPAFAALLESPPAPQVRPPQPLAVSRPSNIAQPSTLDSPPSHADDIAGVEIVPDARGTIQPADVLPMIEPANDEGDIVPVTIEPAPPAAPVGFPAAAAEPADSQAEAIVPIVNVEPPLQAVTTPITGKLPSEPVSDWSLGVFVGVIAVTLLGLLSLAWRAAAGTWRLRSTQPLTDGALRSSLDRLLRERGVRRPVRLACSATTNEPSAGGILNWVIVVPPDIERRLTPAEQHALLAHELAHLVRRDPLWLWVGTALCWCLPFQPLNFLAVRRWRQPAEELCDDWAIAGGVKPLTLANCLTRVAEWRLSPMPVGLTADVGKSRFARRISRLVNDESKADHWSRPSRQRLLFAGALACTLLLTCCGPRMQAAHTLTGEPRDTHGEPRDTNSDPGSVSSRIDGADETLDSQVAGSDSWVAGAGLSAAKEAPDPIDAALPDTPDASLAEPGANQADFQAELAALLSDLERLESLIGDTANDPELAAARAALRARIESIRRCAPP